MSSRSRVDFDERDYYSERRAPSRPPPVRDYDDVDIRIRERESDRVPAFLREDRRPEAGQLVLRQREVETMERRRRSPSPVRVRERIIRARSVSPTPPQRRTEEDLRIRHVERTREPSRVRTRIVEHERERSRSPSPHVLERLRARIVDRPRSPSPVRERIRIVEREKEKERAPTPPPPQPQVIKGPTIEREVITHYRDIDHGMVSVRPPSPPPERHTHRDTEIDIYSSRKQTEIDIHKHSHSHSRGRSHSRERPSPHVHAWDDGVLVHSDRKHLHVDIERRSSSRGRRAQSAAPPRTADYDDEAQYITSKIDSRGKMGEAYGGITKDWTIIDVPPGTERIRMDGAGGASAEVTWQKYSGVRRSKFIPDRDEKSVVSSSTSLSDRDTPRDRERESRLSVQIYDKDREREIEVERINDRRLSIRTPQPPSPAPRRSEMWTEITKDLVVREAIEELGYEYEETEWFFYVMQYLRYEDVLQLVELSDKIRRARKDRLREIQWEREYRDEWDHHHHHHSSSRHRHPRDHWDDERYVETEVVYDSRPRYR